MGTLAKLRDDTLFGFALRRRKNRGCAGQCLRIGRKHLGLECAGQTLPQRSWEKLLQSGDRLDRPSDDQSSVRLALAQLDELVAHRPQMDINDVVVMPLVVRLRPAALLMPARDKAEEIPGVDHLPAFEKEDARLLAVDERDRARLVLVNEIQERTNASEPAERNLVGDGRWNGDDMPQPQRFARVDDQPGAGRHQCRQILANAIDFAIECGPCCPGQRSAISPSHVVEGDAVGAFDLPISREVELRRENHVIASIDRSKRMPRHRRCHCPPPAFYSSASCAVVAGTMMSGLDAIWVSPVVTLPSTNLRIPLRP